MRKKIACWTMNALLTLYSKIVGNKNAKQEIINEMWDEYYDYMTNDVKDILDNFSQEKKENITYNDLFNLNLTIQKGANNLQINRIENMRKEIEQIKKNKDVDKRNN